MNIPKFRFQKRAVIKSILSVFAFSAIFTMFVGFYLIGLFQGYKIGQNSENEKFASLFQRLTLQVSPTPTPLPTFAPTTPPKVATYKPASWGGPQLWEAVNKRRKEFGVNPLSNQAELCTIASIRLNELLELGKLDGHEGFSNMPDRRPDLKWIFEKYSTIAEFLATGGDSPEETVSLWENTLGHKQLLTGGEYVWGCIYAQNTFAVAITAF